MIFLVSSYFTVWLFLIEAYYEHLYLFCLWCIVSTIDPSEAQRFFSFEVNKVRCRRDGSFKGERYYYY